MGAARRRPVKPTIPHMICTDLGGGDGHVFQLAKDVSELHSDEFYILILHHSNDVLFAVAHKAAAR